MRHVFWISLAFVAYAYFGYPLVLWILSIVRPRRIAKASVEPDISVVIAAHNEAETLPAKIENLGQVDYPPDKMQIVVSSDGSTDGTNDLIRNTPGIVALVSDEHAGKAAAINRAVDSCTGEIVVFTDARQQILPDAFRKLLQNFADPAVGSVSGELQLRSGGSGADGVGLYWKFEKAIRSLESATGSVMGVTGAFYATRRQYVSRLPVGLILDDVYSPLKVMEAGGRVVFESEAIAIDRPAFSYSTEFRRKVRTLMGNLELLKYFPWAAVPVTTMGFRFFSHKLLRLLVPWLLIVAYLASAALSSGGLYFSLFVLQTGFYLAGLIAAYTRSSAKILRIPGTFCMLNAAALVAMVSFFKRPKGLGEIWQSTTGVAAAEPVARNEVKGTR